MKLRWPKRELIEKLAGPRPGRRAERGRRARRAFRRCRSAERVIYFGTRPQAEFRAENIEERGIGGLGV